MQIPAFNLQNLLSSKETHMLQVLCHQEVLYRAAIKMQMLRSKLELRQLCVDLCSNGWPLQTPLLPSPPPMGLTALVVCPVVLSEAETDESLQQLSRKKKACTNSLLSLVVVANRAEPLMPS